MNSKILNHIKKVIIVSAIMVLCGTNFACAFSFGVTNGTNKTNYSISGLIELLQKFKKEKYTLSDFQADLEKMQETNNIDTDKIKELFNKLPESDTKSTLEPSIEMFSDISATGESKGIDVKALLSKLLDTLFLSGIDEFMKNGPTKINTEIKPIDELKVIGLVEDCGYTDMEDFSSKSSLIGMGIGLTESNFDYYSKATNSLKYCDLPILIIHGTKDIIVKVENADIVKNTVKGYVEEWLVEGQNHAFIIMGQKKDEYKTHVQDFIDKCTNKDAQTNVPQEPDKHRTRITKFL